jgi:AraC-like DNA-binding protein
MSRRTLQRRLADRGTSYAGVLDGTRRDLAVRYLRDPALQISEVAYLLGFGEAGSFNRAFKRWTGQTPTDFRAAGTGAVDTVPPAALQ